MHRLYILELETQIRNLGGEYECFGLPYWNIGKDVADYGYIYSQYSILNSGLGGDGNYSDNNCVTDGDFTKDVYTPYHCPPSWQSTNGECCLRRTTLPDNATSGFLYTNAQVAEAITVDSFYGRDDRNANTGIRKNLEYGPHGVARMLVNVILTLSVSRIQWN